MFWNAHSSAADSFISLTVLTTSRDNESPQLFKKKGTILFGQTGQGPALSPNVCLSPTRWVIKLHHCSASPGLEFPHWPLLFQNESEQNVYITECIYSTESEHSPKIRFKNTFTDRSVSHWGSDRSSPQREVMDPFYQPAWGLACLIS